jgi:hypothetical protein
MPNYPKLSDVRLKPHQTKGMQPNQKPIDKGNVWE